MQRPTAHVKNIEAAKIIEDVDTTTIIPVTAVKENMLHKTTVIGVEAVAVKPILLDTQIMCPSW